MESVQSLLNLLLRWTHVVAGIMWIGHLYFFNFVNAQVAKTYDADSKKKVVPELMPRALYWFRMGAAYTWITGILLFFLVYSLGGAIARTEGSPLGPHGTGGVIILVWVVAFLVYDQLWRSPLGKNETQAGIVSFVLVVGAAYGMSFLVGGRALYIAVGSLFGTLMAANVWMRIWPAQRKIISGIAGKGPAPDASVPALAGLRSKHNTYMSVPLVLFMVSNHFPTVPLGGFDVGYGADAIVNVVMIGVYIAIGWGVTKLLYGHSAGAAPKAYATEENKAA